MATFCTSYLTFDPFSPGCAEDTFAASVLSGDLAFQEYAACNWFKHLESLLRTTNIETVIPNSLQKAILILQERQRIQSACSWEFESGRLCRADFIRLSSEIQQLYDQTDTILAEDPETRKTFFFRINCKLTLNRRATAILIRANLSFSVRD
jgi:N-glycosylase/DNA lyase